MTKRRLFIYAAGLLFILAVMTLPFQVSSVSGERALQTWPSRTPTPEGGPPPTNTQPPPPPPPTSDPGGPPPADTATPQPNTTPAGDGATPTTAPTIILQTPVGGYDATAQPCGLPPTVQARGQVNIRSGPGLDYDPIGTLIFLEVRPIIGRTQFATWWLIHLPDNTTGWVADQAVQVQGYTGLVPIVEPPGLPGTNVTPTPGLRWDPTPNPACTPLPTYTPTAEPTLPAIEPETVEISNTTPTDAPPSPTPTSESVPEIISPSPEIVAAEATNAPTSTIAAAAISQEPPDEDSPGSASSWILSIGIGLVLLGVVSYVLKKRQAT